ncbi:hypothetical protein [Paraburkholderia sp. GAS32]|uniref:hypothetical protein n=1 Tax=Paraburkholderia sp. GAS32 TaxID=3035129 RepID=UPI003D1AF3CD
MFPRTCLAITRAAQEKNANRADSESHRLEGIWAMFRQFGSLRVVAAAAQMLEFTKAPSLPLPIRPLPEDARKNLQQMISTLDLQ